MPEGERKLNEILDAAPHFEVSREELVLGRTHREARRVAMYPALKVTKLSFVEIAKRLGGIELNLARRPTS